jgi:outer membrane protein assembly factor BamE (lipoprotein component of BamABCDE complex)
MRGRGKAWAVASLVGALTSSACGSSDSSGGQGLGTAGCLSDSQICQFQVGVSTQMDVKAALGNAQEFLGSSTWVYVCQQVVGMSIVHNDEVIFDFDSSGVFEDVTVLRQGTGATPPPSCGASGVNDSSSSSSGGGSGGGCASLPRPAPDSTTCTGVVFTPSTPETTNCMDQGGNKWSATCGPQSCTCTYNDSIMCSCTLPDGGIACCPGVPGGS